jgi:HD superfamily phosphohydrolase
VALPPLLCEQVYPGATHKRFEHSLGVCSEAFKWADRIYGLQRVRKGVRSSNCVFERAVAACKSGG